MSSTNDSDLRSASIEDNAGSAISVVLALIILRLPMMSTSAGKEFQEAATQFQTTCYIAAALPLIGAAFQLFACAIDFIFMRKRVASHRA
jgi:hypothetical protein